LTKEKEMKTVVNLQYITKRVGLIYYQVRACHSQQHTETVTDGCTHHTLEDKQGCTWQKGKKQAGTLRPFSNNLTKTVTISYQTLLLLVTRQTYPLLHRTWRQSKTLQASPISDEERTVQGNKGAEILK
jgi:hypothetical protein